MPNLSMNLIVNQTSDKDPPIPPDVISPSPILPMAVFSSWSTFSESEASMERRNTISSSFLFTSSCSSVICSSVLLRNPWSDSRKMKKTRERE